MTTNQVAYWNYVENSRNHRNMEWETHRANLAKEAETHRANKAQEDIANRNLTLTTADIAEKIRSNKVKEMETQRSNQVNEQERERVNTASILNQDKYTNEMIRNNVANNATNLMLAQETATHNRNVEEETSLHNRNTELLTKFNTIMQDKMNVRTTNANQLAAIQGSQTSQAVGQANVDIARERNDLTRRGQNLSTLSSLIQAGANFYSANIRGASTLLKGGF